MKIANFPDPSLRTAKEPAQLVPTATIISLYSATHDVVPPAELNNDVKEWFATEAIDAGWKKLTWVGEQALLTIEGVVADPTPIKEVKKPSTPARKPNDVTTGRQNSSSSQGGAAMRAALNSFDKKGQF